GRQGGLGRRACGFGGQKPVWDGGEGAASGDVDPGGVAARWAEASAHTPSPATRARMMKSDRTRPSQLEMGTTGPRPAPDSNRRASTIPARDHTKAASPLGATAVLGA